MMRRTMSPREAAIAKLLAVGYSAREVGLKLGLAYKTVEGYRTRIFVIADVDNVVRLTHYMLRNEYIDLL